MNLSEKLANKLRALGYSDLSAKVKLDDGDPEESGVMFYCEKDGQVFVGLAGTFMGKIHFGVYRREEMGEIE